MAEPTEEKEDEKEPDPFMEDAQRWTQHKVHVVAAARRGENVVHQTVPTKGGALTPVTANLSHPTEPDVPREAWPINFMPAGQDVLGNGCIIKRVKKAGLAEAGRPALGNNVKMHYTAFRMDGRQWDTSRGKYDFFHFIIGMNYVNKLMESVIPTMEMGEIAEYVCVPSYAEYNEGTQSKMPRLEKTFQYVIQLYNWREPRAESKFDLTAEEAMEEVEMYKRNAIVYVQNEKWEEASERYHDGLFYLEEDYFDRQEVDDDPELQARGMALMMSCWLNKAMCELKLENYRLAEELCTKAHEQESTNVKALYRRGLARNGLHEFENAKADLRVASELDPRNMQIRDAYMAVKDKDAAADVSDAKFFGKAFINKHGNATELYQPPIKESLWRGPLPRVWMDIRVGASAPARVIFELFADQVPKTAENFRQLCLGSKGRSPVSGTKLNYAGNCFHRVVAGFMVQGGDLSSSDGTGVESIYGGRFADENFALKHSKPGLLSMANTGRDTNGCQFFITTQPCLHLDGEHVVFGQVVHGMHTISQIELAPTDAKDRPREPIVIEACGELQLDSAPAEDEDAKIKKGARG